MDKSLLKKLIKQNLSTREIAEQTGTSQTNIRYWLKKHNLKTKLNIFNSAGDSDRSPCCKTCGETTLDQFYLKRKKPQKDYCRKCLNRERIKVFRNYKLQAIAYKGGKCVKCGYNKCSGSLHFHHVKPNKKDAKNWRFMRNWKFDRIKGELDKCILVCANCHGEIHWNIDGAATEEK